MGVLLQHTFPGTSVATETTMET